MAKIKVGVIGAGAIAQNCHLPGYRAHPDCEIVALAEIDTARAAQAARDFCVPRTYSDYRQMLDAERLDAASICTPNYLHAEMAIAVAGRGINMLLEKPVAVTVDDALAIRQAVRSGGAMAMVAFTHRCYTGNVKIKQLLDEGTIGQPFMIRVRFAHKGPQPGWAMSDWFYRLTKSGGGAMLDMGIHAIDLCHYMIGPVAEVSAVTAILRKDIEVDDNAVMTLKFADGKALGYIEVGWTSCPGFGGLEVYGDGGSILFNYQKPIELILGTVAPDGSGQTEHEQITPPEGLGGWQRQMKTFVDCVRDGTPTPTTIDDGVAATAVACAAMQSAKTGRIQPVQAT